MTTTPGKYFDDFEIGERFSTPGRTITETDLATWINFTGMREPQFVDREYARKTIFGRPIIPAPMTQAMGGGLWSLLGLTQGTAIAFLGSQTRALSPLFIGDTIHEEIEVSNKKRTASKPDRGVITFLHTVQNQYGRAVLSYNITMMMWRRPDLVEVEE